MTGDYSVDSSKFYRVSPLIERKEYPFVTDSYRLDFMTIWLIHFLDQSEEGFFSCNDSL